ncbi:MAG: homocysteine biosynthesis protein, partial [Bacillota bacterium]|nr:homocysteine biosynthesis protein [Bacillota bacterium]
GFISWQGTQFKMTEDRTDKGLPLGASATLAVIGNLKEMSTEYIRPAVFERYGTSMFIGIGIPIPMLDEEMAEFLSVENKDIYTSVFDYSVPHRSRPSLARVSYAELRSGSIDLNGRKIKTAPMSSLYKARKIAAELKDWVKNKSFTLQAPVQVFPGNPSTNTLEEVSE